MLTCLSCRVSFSTNETQKQHYKSEWHHYNITRKIVSLEPITYELFLKIQQKREESCEKKNDLIYKCNVCRKDFNTNNVLQQHIQSKKHKFELEKQEIDINSKDIITIKNKNQHKLELLEKFSNQEEWEDIDPDSINININECLFCPIILETLEDLLKHLGVEHSFFINDIDCCIDIEGLLKHLGEQIKINFKCIKCPVSNKFYNSLDSVQQHMISKRHCKMKTELGEILEYALFYDYTQTYPDDFEDVDDDHFEVFELTPDYNWQLILPSGAVIGHRSLRIYYKQKVDPKKLEREKAKKEQKRRLSKIMSDYKMLGWVGETTKALAIQKARDIKYFNKLRQSYDFSRTNKLKNIASQPHFRSQIMK